MHDLLIHTFILFFVGSMAGVLGAILGLGGGIIVTPILVIGFHLPIQYAIATSIVAVIATSSGASIAYLKDDLLNVKVAMFLEIFTTIGALIGALLVGVVAPQILNILFGTLLLYQAYTMYQKLRQRTQSKVPTSPDPLAETLELNNQYFDPVQKQTITYQLSRVKFGALIMTGAGLASGLLGIGSGMFKVFAMDTVMKMPLKPSSATSNLMMGVTGAASGLVYFFNGMIKPEIATPIALGILLGASMGAKVMPHLPTKTIRIIFIPVVLFSGLQLLFKAFNITLY